MKSLAAFIKERYPGKIVFAGGPEVSFEPESFVNDFDYVLCGEGEEIIIPFLNGLKNNNVSNIPGVADKTKPNITPYITHNMANIPNIFDMYSEDDIKNRVIYLELSRGCPFKCSYCLSSLESGVRTVDDKKYKATFDFIKSRHFKCIKFLDRTFNIKPTRFIEICKILQTTDNIYQFEIEAGLFTDEVINFLCNEVKPQKFRLEIGIQSLNDKSISAVNRVQNNKSLLETIKKINSYNRCTIHIDLIAGLPFETLDTFIDGFNTAFLLECEELQLGFLKMLRGTKIRNEADNYGYVYDDKEPYEIIKNAFISKEDMKIIHKCEESLEWLWNGKNAVNLIKHFIDENIISDWFSFFVGFYDYYNKALPLHKNFENLLKYLDTQSLLQNDFIDDLKLDYLSKVKIRPQPFWKNFAFENFKSLKKQLFELGKINDNCFATSYYDGHIIIDYNNPDLSLKIIK